MMNKFMKLLLNSALAILLFAAPFSVFAQNLSVDFKPSSNSIRIGEEILLPLALNNPNNININTIKVTVVIPKRDFEIENFWFENSLVPLWIEDPLVTETDSTFLLTFTGLIPGGTDKSGDLVTIVLRALGEEGQTSIRLIDASAYKNSRQAELVPLAEQYTFFSLLTADDDSIPRQDIVLKDLEPPEDFFPIVAKSAELFDGDYFLMFHTIDRQTGIDRFEILESETFYDEAALAEGSSLYWRIAENPARLSDQSLESYLYVRAYDNAGNHRTVIIPPTSFVVTSSVSVILRIVTRLALFLLVISVAFFLILRKKRVAHEEVSPHSLS